MKTKFKKNHFTSVRNLPKNIKAEDKFLFEHELNRRFEGSKIFFVKKIYIHKTKLSKFKYFQVYSAHWRMHKYLLKYKVRFFLNNFLSFIKKELKDEEVISINKASWVIDQKSYKYMHWFSDSLQRIEQIKKYLQEYPIIIEDRYENYKYVLETLEILNIPYIVCERTKIYKVKDLLISSHSAPAGNYNEDLVQSISKQFKNLAKKENNSTNFKKIWITRENASIRKIKNFQDIKQIIEKFNYKIIALEEYSLLDQIDMLYNAKVIAGLQGAGLNNILFMKNGSKVLEIRDREDNKNNCYFSLSSALNIDFFYCTASSVEKGNFHSSDYIVDPEKLTLSFKEIEESL